MAQQIDIHQSTQLGSGTQPNGIEFHGPAGATASTVNANSDFPPLPPKSGAASTAVVVKVSGCRFANPS